MALALRDTRQPSIDQIDVGYGPVLGALLLGTLDRELAWPPGAEVHGRGVELSRLILARCNQEDDVRSPHCEGEMTGKTRFEFFE